MRQNLFELAENLPDSKRKAALAMLVRKWSPFPSTQFAAQWIGNKASVYAWDGTSVAEAITAAGHHPAGCVVWPESFLREPLADGYRLAVMTDGFEGQVWRQGLLAATRWWAALPAPRDWIAFLRASGIDVSQVPLAVPAPVEVPLLSLPWTADNTPITDVWSLLQNDRAAAIAATVVAAPFLYLLGEAAVVGAATLRAEYAIAELSAANQSVRTDRSDALTNLDVIESYLSLEPFPRQFEILATTSTLLSGQKAAIAEWIYDSGTLDIVIQTEAPADATHFIELFERDDLFSNVSGTIGGQGKELRLKMDIARQIWPVS